MNRRLSRFALLAVLILSMLGGFGGNTIERQVALAQANCAFQNNVVDAEQRANDDPVQNPEEIGVEIVRSFTTTTQSNQNLDAPKSLTDMIVFDGSEITIVSDQSSIIYLESGVVQLIVCDGTTVGVQELGDEQPTEKAGSYEVTAGSAIYIDPEDSYSLIAVSGEPATPQASLQPLEYDLAVDVLPSGNLAAAGPTMTFASGPVVYICSGGRCWIKGG